jgi:hypothetical protein
MRTVRETPPDDWDGHRSNWLTRACATSLRARARKEVVRPLVCRTRSRSGYVSD